MGGDFLWKDMSGKDRTVFTGIVEEKGRVVRVEHRSQVERLTLEVPWV